MRSLALPAAALAFALAGPARAYDPAYTWQTLETPHFQIHFHQGEYALAQRAAQVAEAAHRRLAPLLGHEPEERCQVVIVDDSDDANGSATPTLYNVVRLNAPPPDSRSELNDFDDWVWLLLSHEYTHILHLDTIDGVPKLYDDAFGKLLAPNALQPRWFVEGLAVFEESRSSAGGRVRSSWEDMQLRALALGGSLLRLDELSSEPYAWPRGEAFYLYGGRFLHYLAARFGEGAFAQISHDYGGRLVPYGLNISAESATGESYPELYAQFTASLTDEAQRQAEAIRAEGETVPERLTNDGENPNTPRWRKDGRALYYAFHGADALPEVRELLPGCATWENCARQRPARLRAIATSFGLPALALAPDGALIVARPEIFHEYETYQDLWRVDPATGAETRLSWGLRAQEPDAGPDGAIVFTLREPGGHTAIALLPPGASTPLVLYRPPGFEPVGAPRLSSDGGRLAFVEHRDGRWRVRVGELERQRDATLPAGTLRERAVEAPTAASLHDVRDASEDPGQQLDPAFTADGRALVFSSDRTGVYNVYGVYNLAALPAAAGDTVQLTNVVTGALQPAPSPDGRALAFLTYGPTGFDLARVPLTPRARTAPLPQLPGEAGPETRPVASFTPTDDAWPAHPYSPVDTLARGYRLPLFAADARGAILGVQLGGYDVLGRHDYGVDAWWGFASKTPGFDAAYADHRFRADLSFGASRYVEDVPYAPPGYAQSAWRTNVTASLPFTTLDHAQSFSVAYAMQYLSRFGGFAMAPGERLELPPSGRIATVTAGYTFSSAKRFTRSISPEQGARFSVAATLSHPDVGSEFIYRLVTAGASAYAAMPFAWEGRPLHHALAVRVSGGYGSGDFSANHLFNLGGLAVSAPVNLSLGGDPISVGSSSSHVLRGYPPGWLSGPAFVLMSGEYRVPLWDEGFGLWTLPLYVRRLHAAVFADAGDAFVPANGADLKAGVGGELRLEIALGYQLVTDVRLGYARGLAGPAVCAPRGVDVCNDAYFTLGGEF